MERGGERGGERRREGWREEERGAGAREEESQPACSFAALRLAPRLGCKTNGVNTNGAAAKVMNFDRLGKKVRPGTFVNIKAG